MVILMLGAQKKMTDQPCKRDALHKGQHDPCKRVYSNFLELQTMWRKKQVLLLTWQSIILLSNKQLCTGGMKIYVFWYPKRASKHLICYWSNQ